MVRLTKEDRRRQIIESAARIFAEHGLAGARTREIAEACDVNEALLYKHFESKDELFADALDHFHREFAKIWYSQAESNQDGRSILLNVLQWQAEAMFDNPLLCANMLHGLAAATCNGKMRDGFSKWFEEHNKFYKSIIKKGIDDGSLDAGIDPDHIIWLIKGMTWLSIFMNAIGGPNYLTKDILEKVYRDIVAPETSCNSDSAGS